MARLLLMREISRRRKRGGESSLKEEDEKDLMESITGTTRKEE